NYYFSDLPFLALWGTKYVNTARSIGHFFADAAAGTLPSYSYIDPLFLGEGQGGSNDDHPHADIRRGQALVGSIVNALIQGPAWEKTLMVLTYDEWGGFFDHVVPPRRPDLGPLSIGARTYDRTQTGFRVPAFLISPYARPGVAHTLFDHGSIPRLAEWRWGLKPLQPRDRAAANPAGVLDFGYRNPVASLPVVLDPGPHDCQNASAVGTGMANADPFWAEL